MQIKIFMKIYKCDETIIFERGKVKENHERWIGYLDEDMITRLNIAVDKHIPTVIEADKEASNE